MGGPGPSPLMWSRMKGLVVPSLMCLAVAWVLSHIP